jgi:acetyltransferase
VDLLGDAGPDRYARALEVVAKDPNTDGVLVILTPQAMTAE